READPECELPGFEHEDEREREAHHHVGLIGRGAARNDSTPCLTYGKPMERGATDVAGIICGSMSSRCKAFPMADSRVLVTGGAGFIGSYLVPSLLQLDATVLVVDDLSRGRREHLEGLAQRLGLRVR